MSPATPFAGDSVAALLGELSQSDLTQLLKIVDAVPHPGEQARAEELLTAAVEAVAARNTGRALDLFRQLAALDPARSATLLAAPALASIRPGMEQLLNQLTAAARLHAEGKLGEATLRLETTNFKEPSSGEARPETFLLVAGRLIEAGGLANYVRSAAISAVVIEQYRWAPAPGAELAENQTQSGWHLPPRLSVAAWVALGLASAGLCWWLRDDYLPFVCEIWAGGLFVLMTFLAWRRLRRF